MASIFITNEKNNTLKDRIVEVINSSKELRFLVGFFYFSGIKELYESLKNNPRVQIDVLVGLGVDKLAHELVEYSDTSKDLTDRERVERFFTSISKSINSDEFDTKEFYTQIKYFIELIKTDKLRIRKTINPNHAKLYIFKLKENAVKSTILITGSSNLTKAGLVTQEELNVEISDYGTKDAEDYFENLWVNSSIKITEIAEFKKELILLLENKTLITAVSPFEAFAFILKTYIDAQNQLKVKESIIELLSRKGYKPYQYQLDAVSQALTVLKNPDTPNGIIVADVVGLGKSIIASLIAKSLNKRGVIICPPGIIGDRNKRSGWEKYKEDFELYDWEIRSCGIENLKHTLELLKDNDEFEVIIVDEVHRFRNQDTEAYEVLSNICRNKIVILLSATPVNNTPADIFSLLKLFVVPGKSKISLDNDLSNKFKEYSRVFKKLSNIRKYYKSIDRVKRDKALTDYETLFGDRNVDPQKIKERAKYLSQSIRQVIESVLIRRNRIDLKKDPVYSKEVYELSNVQDPKELFYKLTKEQVDFYEKVLTTFFGEDGQFRGAIYRPFMYETALIDADKIEGSEKNFEYQSQNQLYDFMRRLLVKRFESSFGAFKQSIHNFCKVTEKVKEFIEKSGNKFILDRKLLISILEEDIDDIESALLTYEQKLGEGNYPKSYKVYDVSKFTYKEQFLADIDTDIHLYRTVLEKLDKLQLVDNDPKFNSLVNEVRAILTTDHPISDPTRKIIIFTEYLDTAKYLQEILEKEFPHKILSVTGDLTDLTINEILENFDASYEHQKDNYSVLLATDRISEGFNLNRAGAIINYDIPWNPTRVIQRVGRINRISKKVFDNLYIYNFFPTETGAEFVRSREIAADKMYLIHNTLGEDSKIFEPDEEPSAAELFKRIQTNPEKIEEESFSTKLRRIYADIEEHNPEVIERINTLPHRIKVAKKYQNYNISLFMKKGIGFYIRGMIGTSESITDIPFEMALPFIKCSKSEKQLPLSDRFWEYYIKVKEYKEQIRTNTTEMSLERRAINNLHSLIANHPPEVNKYLSFLRNLLEDIVEYKTLSNFTLRRLANMPTTDLSPEKLSKLINELDILNSDLGANYLIRVKEHLGDLKSEIIIAFENHQ